MSKFKVLLVGGPSIFPEEQRVHFSSARPSERIKYPFGAGYEHFVHEGAFREVDGEELAVYRWETRTAIAE